MILHHYITLQELVEYCQFAHEFNGKCGRVKVDAPTLNRIRQVARLETQENRFFGIKFVEK